MVVRYTYMFGKRHVLFPCPGTLYTEQYQTSRHATPSELLKPRCRLLNTRKQRRRKISSLESRRVPNTSVSQTYHYKLASATRGPHQRLIKPTVIYRMIPRMIQKLLSTLYRNRALGRDQRSQLGRRIQRGGLGLVDLADEAHAQRLGGGEISAGETYLLDPRGAADDLGQAAEGSNVGCHADIDLFDGESGVAGTYPDVGRAGNVDC